MIARAGTQWKVCPYRAADSWTWCLKLGYTPSPKSCGHLFTGKIWIHATGNLWDVGILQIPYRVTIEILGYRPFRRLHFGLRDLILCGEKAEISRWCGCSHGRRNGVYQGTHKGPTSVGHDKCIQKIPQRRCMTILDPSPMNLKGCGATIPRITRALVPCRFMMATHVFFTVSTPDHLYAWYIIDICLTLFHPDFLKHDPSMYVDIPRSFLMVKTCCFIMKTTFFWVNPTTFDPIVPPFHDFGPDKNTLYMLVSSA